MMTGRVALVGMYGGYFGERNPGCFLILEATLAALQRRLPDVMFDIYAEDAIARFEGLREQVVHGRELRFFSSQWGTTLLRTSLASYDAIVLGGDVILAPPPAPSVFLLESPELMESPRPPVFYNAAHTALSAEEILTGPHAERFRRLCARADYVGVRTEYAEQGRLRAGQRFAVGSDARRCGEGSAAAWPAAVGHRQHVPRRSGLLVAPHTSATVRGGESVAHERIRVTDARRSDPRCRLPARG